MAVRKHGKYYRIDYYVGKKRIREILKGVTTKREAEEVERERLRNSTGPIEFKRFEGLARWFLFALKKGEVSRVPTIDLLPEDNVRQRFITEGEFQKILPFLSGDVLPVVVIAYHTAMRHGEILALRWKDIDLKRRLFLFETEKTRKRKQRAVALHPEIVKLFQSMPRGFGETPVFNLKKDRVQRNWRRACQKAKVKDAIIHDFRRTRATIWHKEQGLAQDLIMHMTGHQTDSMFRRYQIVSTEYVEKLAEKWSDEEENQKAR